MSIKLPDDHQQLADEMLEVIRNSENGVVAYDLVESQEAFDTDPGRLVLFHLIATQQVKLNDNSVLTIPGDKDAN